MDNIEAKLNQYQPQILSIFRIVFGLLILQHGFSKWFGFPMPSPAGISLAALVGWAGVIELICGGLVLVGLFTRYAAFLLSGQMAVAYFYAANRLARGFTPLGNGGNLEVAYCFAFLLLVFFGAGVWSLDAQFRKKT